MFKSLIKRYYYKQSKKYQRYLSNEIAKKYNYRIIEGPFKNLKLIKNSSWGKGDLGTKILGQYERHIQNLIVSLQKQIVHSF